MARKWIATIALAMLAMVIIAGCSSNENKDPYAEVTLRQGLYGDPPVISKGYKYKIVDPEILKAVEHLLLVRQGDITTIIAGRSIAEKIEGMDKNHLTFNCVKKYSPFVHYKAEQVVSGTDTVFVTSTGSIYYPGIVDTSAFTSRDHDETPMSRFRWNDSAGLRKMVDQKFAVKSQLAKVEEDGEEVWMLVGPRGSLRLSDINNHQEIVLELLMENNMEFNGGITFNEVEDFADRRNNQVAGTVKIDYVQLFDKVFTG